MLVMSLFEGVTWSKDSPKKISFQFNGQDGIRNNKNQQHILK